MTDCQSSCLFCSDEEEEQPVLKSKKSSKKKGAASKAEPLCKKDPVQYVSETGDSQSVFNVSLTFLQTDFFQLL